MNRKATTRAVKTAPKQHMGKLVVSQTQVGLALGFGTIGLIMAFGMGFIVGMWYQASEQIASYDAEPTPVVESRPQDPPMTFYSTLSESEKGASESAKAAVPSTPGVAHEPPPETSVFEDYYSVQVGSFRAREPAERLRGRLVQKGYPARVQSSTVPGKGIWYRVRVGEFPNRADADRTAQRLVSRERLSVMITNTSQ